MSSVSTRSEADYRSLLLREYQLRKQRNPRYSIRGFARLLGVGKTTLADTLARRRHLAKQSALRVGERLCLSPTQTRRMLDEIGGGRRRLRMPDFHPVQDDCFSLIADWHHYALLALAKLGDNRADVPALAARLGIGTSEVREALERLVRLRFLEVRDGRLVRLTAGLATPTDVPSAALRRHHQQLLRLAEGALENEPVQRRDFSTLTMAIDPANLPEAKRLIRNFRRKLSSLLESREQKEVYTLAIQLFPLIKIGDA